eukprot:CAMPEP_0117760178 /NCGR_PEP_ID=MMETSP0947-20121206/16451_1 /TAXON_ID=44440 /ORGANISM="Chattonella subsalsa, Strain CCMP2191" /LENGTH=281 /DNA_ID=CAMNT_0005580771 /DNA_START=172 /DNA_END=1017 /DNA_ORIENTATION=+
MIVLKFILAIGLFVLVYCQTNSITNSSSYVGETLFFRECNEEAATNCLEEYAYCLRSGGPAADIPTQCSCATILYGICLRQVGCAAQYMVACVAELMELDCHDITVCGNNCATDGLITDEEIIIPVNNFGNNYLRFTTCDKTYNSRKLNKFGMVISESCDDDSRVECPYWVPPRTFTALAFSPDVSNLKMEYCVYDTENSHCLTEPEPAMYYGIPKHWPASFEVEDTDYFFCAADEDCPGSYCDHTQSPPKCAEKTLKSFEATAANYFDHPYGDGHDREEL